MNAIMQALTEATGTTENDWEIIDGPDSRCGVDYWFRNKKTGQEAYVNDDQGHITVETDEEEHETA